MTTSKVELRDGMVIGRKATDSAGIQWRVSLDAKRDEVVLTVIAGSYRYLGDTDRREAPDLIEDLGPDGHLTIVSTPPAAEPVQLYRRDLEAGDRFAGHQAGSPIWIVEVNGGVQYDRLNVGAGGAALAHPDAEVFNVIRAAQSTPTSAPIADVFPSGLFDPPTKEIAERYAAAAAKSTRRTLEQQAAKDAAILKQYEEAQRHESTAFDFRGAGTPALSRAALLYTSAVTARLRARDEQRRIATAVRCEGTVAREGEFDDDGEG